MHARPASKAGIITVLATLSSVIACGSSSSSDSSSANPLGCALPTPCSLGEMTQSSTDVTTQDTAACMYKVLTTGQPAHLTVRLHDLRDQVEDLYTNGKDPAILVSQHCDSSTAPCVQDSIKKCQIQVAQYLDCSGGQGPQRVCGMPINWCQTSIDVDTASCP